VLGDFNACVIAIDFAGKGSTEERAIPKFTEATVLGAVAAPWLAAPVVGLLAVSIHWLQCPAPGRPAVGIGN